MDADDTPSGCRLCLTLKTEKCFMYRKLEVAGEAKDVSLVMSFALMSWWKYLEVYAQVKEKRLGCNLNESRAE